MSTASITLPPSGAATRATPRVWRAGLAASAAWLALAALTALWPNKEIGFSDWAYTHEFAILCAVLAAATWPTSASCRCRCATSSWTKATTSWPP